MDDENAIPPQKIVDLPKTDDIKEYGGISFEPEKPVGTGSEPDQTNITAPSAAVPPVKTAGAILQQPAAASPKETVEGAAKTQTAPLAASSADVLGAKEYGGISFEGVAPAHENVAPKNTDNEVPGMPKEIPPAKLDSPAPIAGIPVSQVHAEAPVKPPDEGVVKRAPIVRPEPIKMPGGPDAKPETKEAPPEKTSTLRAIRTYQADVAESVKGQKTSLVRMVVAEQARKQKIIELDSPRNKWNMVFIIGGFILLLSGTVAAVVFFNKYKQFGTVAEQQAPRSFIFAEKSKTISTAGLQNEVITKTIAKEIASANNKLDTMENIALVENIGGSDVPLTTQRLFYFLDNRMPPSLLRSLDKEFMLGVHTFNGNNPFIILKTNFYENTFAGMLGWEQYMARDLFPVFGIEKSPDDQAFIRPLEDRTVKNRDTRVLEDDNGNMLLLYTFKDRETLIITTSGDTMGEVIRRLNSSGPINR